MWCQMREWRAGGWLADAHVRSEDTRSSILVVPHLTLAHHFCSLFVCVLFWLSKCQLLFKFAHENTTVLIIALFQKIGHDVRQRANKKSCSFHKMTLSSFVRHSPNFWISKRFRNVQNEFWMEFQMSWLCKFCIFTFGTLNFVHEHQGTFSGILSFRLCLKSFRLCQNAVCDRN